MIHRYYNNGYYIVLDVNSGAVHVVDELAYEVIGLYESRAREEIVEQLKDRWTEEEIREALEQGVHPVSLGRRILRTETAGLAVLSLLMMKLEGAF